MTTTLARKKKVSRRRDPATVGPDRVLCARCLAELLAADGRRSGDPFIHCNECGPRFSLFLEARWSREASVLASRPPCKRCRDEAAASGDRRHGLETVACPECGPTWSLLSAEGDAIAAGRDAVGTAVEALSRGRVVAVQGIGAFRLWVDAEIEPVLRLRERRQGDATPWGVLAPGAALDAWAELTAEERRAVESEVGPAVLATPARGLKPDRLRAISGDAPWISVRMPHDGIEHLLSAAFGRPAVVVPAGLEGDPAPADPVEARHRLAGVADLFLAHDLEGAWPSGDSVVRTIAGSLRVIRAGRGLVPIELTLTGDAAAGAVLGVGGTRSSALALAFGGHGWLAPDAGRPDVGPARDLRDRSTAWLGSLTTEPVTAGVVDLHPDLPIPRGVEIPRDAWRGCPQDVGQVHACAADHGIEDSFLGIAWNGTSLGDDGTLWGGEFLICEEGTYRRFAHLRPFSLPGGEQAIREPRRAALGLLYEFLGQKMLSVDWLNPMRACQRREIENLGTMLFRGFNAPRSTSMARLLDAVASLTDLRQIAAFEEQPRLDLEREVAAEPRRSPYPYEVTGDESAPWIVDWEPMVRELVRDVNRGVPVARIVARVYRSLAEMALEVARRSGELRVVLAGSCFTDRRLTEWVVSRLSEESFEVFLPRRLPIAETALPLGQVAWLRRAMAATEKEGRS